MRIRPATQADDDAIWEILRPVFRAGETYCLPRDISRADALAYWSGGHEAFVAVTGEVLGTYFLCANQKGGGAHVCNCGFATAPAAQGQGVARAMLDHALDTARARGYRAMQFNFVVSSNTRALELWERAGFRSVGRLPGAFDHPRFGFVDALILFKTLTPHP
ncbi:GNAT family N-acetyltransferase [Rhodovulum imhoffii]|nr:N-acetyltransferase [Rhodovulum imhoffii]MBK5932762.1 GNAT family N-acetyltransferase [Rhodovulum imhoffii]